MNLDLIEADEKNCFLHPNDRNHRLLILAKTLSEKLFETLSDRIECDRKNHFLPLYHFRNNLSFAHINTFSKKSTQDEFRSN
jgi:hypothetical protein